MHLHLKMTDIWYLFHFFLTEKKNEIEEKQTSPLETRAVTINLATPPPSSPFLPFSVHYVGQALPNAQTPANAEWTIPMNKETRHVTSSSKKMSPSKTQSSDRKMIMANADVQINFEWCWSSQKQREKSTDEVKKSNSNY